MMELDAVNDQVRSARTPTSHHDLVLLPQVSTASREYDAAQAELMQLQTADTGAVEVLPCHPAISGVDVF